MSHLHYTQYIDAPREKVWHAMLDDAPYREWTSPFNPGGSWYEGSWEEGSEIRFIGPSEEGKFGGMIGTIVANRPNELVTIRYRGQIFDGKDDFDSDAVKVWVGGTETYTFMDQDGGTLVKVDIDASEEAAKLLEEAMGDAWPRALAKLKEIAERA